MAGPVEPLFCTQLAQQRGWIARSKRARELADRKDLTLPELLHDARDDVAAGYMDSIQVYKECGGEGWEGAVADLVHALWPTGCMLEPSRFPLSY